jgi:hypothetical protein
MNLIRLVAILPQERGGGGGPRGHRHRIGSETVKPQGKAPFAGLTVHRSESLFFISLVRPVPLFRGLSVSSSLYEPLPKYPLGLPV